MLQAQKVGHLHFAWPGGVDRWVSNHLQLTLGNDIEKLKKEIAELEEITGADNDAMMNDEVGYKKGALKEKQELLARGESGEVAFDHDMVIMHDEYEGRNAAERIVSDYKTAVAKKKYTIESPVGESYTELANLPDSLRPKGLVQPGAEGVSTNVRCETCHEAQFKFQQTTPHYSAILALATKDQHLNRECLTCHTIGFKEPQGWVDPNRLVRGARGREFHTADFIKEVMKADLPEFKGKQMRVRQDRRRWERLHERYLTLLKPYIAKPQKPSASEVSDGTRVYMGVQCEHCHGRRLNHPADGRQYPNAVQKDTCLTCHTPENDDSFSFEKKLPLVACPRMKK
jgi:transcription elongation GreA/GreB family factor